MKVVSVGLAVIGMASVQSPAFSQPRLDQETLAGLWVGKSSAAPAISGAVTLRRIGGAWEARVGRRWSMASVQGKHVSFAIGRTDSFSGEIGPGGKISGLWKQAPTLGSALTQALETPLVLRREKLGGWEGEITPAPADFTLYLRVFRGPAGEWLAAFRNPQLNSTGGASQFTVTRNPSGVRFDALGSRKVSVSAVALESPARIRIQWDDAGSALDLHRANPLEAKGFYPRPLLQPPYSYRPPRNERDGWKVARGSDVGVDEATLTKVVRAIAAVDPSERRPDLVHSLLIARHGRLVLEEYFFGYDEAAPHDLRSASKTFASVLLGVEIFRGSNLTENARIYEYLASLGPFAHPDPRKTEITLRELLTHTSGLDCDDNNDASSGNEATMQSQTTQADWWKYTLDLAVMHDPGSRYAYCSAGINLVGNVLSVSSGLTVPQLFARDVAVPLRFGRWYWNLAPNGAGYLGGGAMIRPRDLLKVGQVYLNGGVWSGRRIVSASWINKSTTPSVSITPASTGLSDSEFQNSYALGADAMAWHRAEVTANGRSYSGYAAGGNGGQELLVFPSLDLVVVFTGGNYGQYGIWGKWAQKFLGDAIIPSIKQ